MEIYNDNIKKSTKISTRKAGFQFTASSVFLFAISDLRRLVRECRIVLCFSVLFLQVTCRVRIRYRFENMMNLLMAQRDAEAALRASEERPAGWCGAAAPDPAGLCP